MIQVYVIKRNDGYYYQGHRGCWTSDITTAKFYGSKRSVSPGLGYVKNQLRRTEYTAEVITLNCVEA
jgi:hypothetical protein